MIRFAWILLLFAPPLHALIAPVDKLFTPPDPDLSSVRVVQTIGAEDALRLETKGGEVIRSFQEDELISPEERSSNTLVNWKGASWMRGTMVLHHGDYFVIRLAWGRLLVFDLRESRLLSPLPSPKAGQPSTEPHGEQHIPDETLAELLAEFDALALANLTSSRAEERRIAAIVCGKRNLTEAIPLLRKIARNDPGYHHVFTSVEDSRKVYFVREAAKEALAQMERANTAEEKAP